MTNTTSTAIPSPQPDIPALLDELAGSGQSTASFARAHGLPPWKLYQALRQRQRRSQRASRARRKAGADLVPVHVASTGPTTAPIELITTGGLRLVVPASFDEAHLRRLLGVLA
ncbi:MAG TPA: hypothetical protein VFD43_06950 [Planctomycetota bacterium]|nr:hypothetical protein [Planctomycetota bacterium]